MSSVTSNQRSKSTSKSSTSTAKKTATEELLEKPTASEATSCSVNPPPPPPGTTNTTKRPYRRTRRPVGYNDKSSSTTTTNVLFQQPLNVYDAIIAESQDLYNAAVEAQLCSRYKIASSYLLLLHTRLVGLGKRFDKSIIHHHYNKNNNEPKNSDELNQNLSSDPMAICNDNEEIQPPTLSNKRQRTSSQSISNTIIQEHQEDGKQPAKKVSSQNQVAVKVVVPEKVTSKTSNTNSTQLLQLPSNIEVDTAMMEHLARAAAELHAARKSATSSTATTNAVKGSSSLSPHRATTYTSPYRTNHHKKGTSTLSNEKPTLAILQSPDTRTFFQSTTNVQYGTTTAANETGVASNLIMLDSSNHNNNKTGMPLLDIDDDDKNEKIVISGDDSTTPKTTPKKTTKRKMSNSTSDNTTGSTSAVDEQVVHSSSTAKAASTSTSIVTSITRKPVTAAINTVPYANCNVRSLLLQGASPTTTKASTTMKTNSSVVQESKNKDFQAKHHESETIMFIKNEDY